MVADFNDASVFTFLFHFGTDLMSLVLVGYVMYFRRHSRRDLLMTYTCFNIGLFLVMSVMSFVEPHFNVGFKLFAILSIIRIRSEKMTNVELSYAFMILVIGLINAFGMHGVKISSTLVDDIVLVCLNLVAIAIPFFLDHPRLLKHVGRRQITLDKIYTNETNLRADLEQRMNAKVLDYAIAHIDYMKETTVLDVRYAS